MNEIQQPQQQQHQPDTHQSVKKNADVYSILIVYYIELIEAESKLKTASGYGVPATKQHGDRFITVFYKLFNLTKFQLSRPLVKQINRWLSDFRYATLNPTTGIPLAQAVRDELEEKGVILLFQDTVVPPFVSPMDRMDLGEERDADGI